MAQEVSETTGGDEVSSAYARRVGERLRAIRKQQDLSLQDVEERSDHEFKASVLGAYERGERAISVPRLQRLAQFYGVPVDQLLPGEMTDIALDAMAPPARTAASDLEPPLRIDLQALAHLEGDARELLARFLRTIQTERQDYNGQVLTIRRDDERALACLLDTAPQRLRRHLGDLGVLAGR